MINTYRTYGVIHVWCAQAFGGHERSHRDDSGRLGSITAILGERSVSDSKGADSDLDGVNSDWVKLARDLERVGLDMEQIANFTGMHSGMTVELARGLIEPARTEN